MDLTPERYLLATVHRAENTDNFNALTNIVEAFGELSKRLPLIWPLHPRTRKSIEAAGLESRLEQFPQVKLVPPVGYFDMLALERGAAAILTDSGG
ncbi:MAG TPA: UDP-N-acetylglucosamine 2-epimerase (non-hydrolyzing), partial [Syntrophaceae bacterium]|nr:UDP-N-acetylglucosamine 2-epimerase (non-hydrolyzing) [Syntrophaceae bacterium]